MTPLLLNSQDIQGGAARAAYRLHSGLRSIGVSSRMLVQRKTSDDPDVYSLGGKTAFLKHRLISFLDRVPLRLYSKRRRVTWGVGWMPTLIGRRIAQINPDVINLHWVSDGFVPIHAIQQFKKPIVWSLHDQWPLTGGCHYDQECGRYQRRCGDCPLLGSKSRYDISYLTLLAKRLFWRNADITIVALSNWLAECARKSSLFYDRRIEIIPNGVDLSRFKPISKDIARNILDLPPQKKLILFGAMNSAKDRRKGFHLLQPALQQLAVQGTERNAEAVIFGARQPDHVPDVGMHIHYTGQLHDEVSLALLYAAADVFVAPSLQDNLPNTVMEALACGTPCVGFNIGGIPDMIEHQQNGYLAQPFETDDLARGIAWVLEDEERHRRLSQRAREKVVQEFSIERQARAYLKLYEEVVGQ